MPPVEELAKVPKFPNVKERYRIAGDGGPLGVGRCPYSLYKDILVNPNVQRVNFDSFVGKIHSCRYFGINVYKYLVLYNLLYN